MGALDNRIAEAFCRPGDVVLDIGAYRGELTAAYLGLGAARVHAFEPDPASFAVLEAAFSGEARVSLHSVALSDQAGTAALIHPADKVGKGSIVQGFAARVSHAFGSAKTRREAVAVARLDDLALEPAHFWKIDVEGAELLLLQGAAATLSTAPPRVVQIEIFSAPYNLKGHQPAVIAELSRHFRHHWVAGLTEAGGLALFHPLVRTSEEFTEAATASRRGGAPTFVFSNEPLGPVRP